MMQQRDEVQVEGDRKSTRLNSSHLVISYAVFCLKKKSQIHSMQSLQAHGPEMKAIQQKYKHDRAKLNEELMKFYRENHINPAASCLPLLTQFPVFIALYLTLRHAKEVNGSFLHIVRRFRRRARPTGRGTCCSRSTP